MLCKWAAFYGISNFATFDEAEAEGEPRFRPHWNGLKQFFDSRAYAGRCRIVAELFLSEANNRAVTADATAFCHIVGLGLGAWEAHLCQMQIQVDAYADVAACMN